MKKHVIVYFSVFVLLCSCSKDPQGIWKSYVTTNENIVSTSNTRVDPFNTIMQINYFLEEKNNDINDEIFNDVTSIFDKEVARLHKIFDRHYSYYDDNGKLITNVKTINDSYGTNEAIKCSDELYDLIKLGVESYELTDGLFNIFTGSITDYWNNNFNEAMNFGFLKDFDPYYNEQQREKLELLVDSLPSTIEEINQQLTFDDVNKTITFNKCEFNNEIKPLISVGGIAKGYATDIIKQKLVSMGYDEGTLFSGGSSITTLGKPIFTKEQKGQKISVKNPEKSTFFESVMAFSLKISEEFSFSTSGNYTTNKSYRFNDDEGNLIYRHHIINPKTGYPESFHRSVSITTNYFSNAMVDIFSTAFMNLDVDDGLELRKNILNKYKDSNLDMIYLDQIGMKDAAIYNVVSTSDFSDTFDVNEGVNVKYEK